MLYIYLEFEWDLRKDEANLLKHGLRFSEALGLWQDPFSFEVFDPDSPVDEDRWVRIGITGMGRIVVAVSCDRETRTRIISARSATEREERKYREQFK